MAKKPATQAPAVKATSTTPTKQPPPTSSTPAPIAKAAALSPRSSPQEIAVHVWDRYIQDTPSRTLFLDVFLLYIALNGAIQFVYCVIGGNYPFNAFLSGFSAAVGQFVLTVSLRMQTTERPPAGASSTAKKSLGSTSAKAVDGVTGELVEEKDGQSKISSERAFADFVFGSLILHGFCVNFIN